MEGGLRVAGVHGGQEGPGRAVPEDQVAARQGLLCHLPIRQLLGIASAQHSTLESKIISCNYAILSSL